MRPKGTNTCEVLLPSPLWERGTVVIMSHYLPFATPDFQCSLGRLGEGHMFHFLFIMLSSLKETTSLGISFFFSLSNMHDKMGKYVDSL